MIRRCTGTDFAVIHAVINEAAESYRGAIPADCWHEPYMTVSALEAEIAAGVEFWGWEESGALIGVMGLQEVRGVTLIRHAYVRTAHQGRGIGGALLDFLAERKFRRRRRTGFWTRIGAFRRGRERRRWFLCLAPAGLGRLDDARVRHL